MLALQQNVYIPKNHKLQIDIPQNIPAGENELFMVFQPKVTEKHKRINFSQYKINVFKDIDSVKFQREIRDEW